MPNGPPEVVRVGNNTSATLILNTGASQGCVLRPLLYSLFTHDCVAKHDSNTVITFADDTTVVGLITDNNETAFGEEVRDLAVWCQDNKLSLNVSKSKELIMDYRKRFYRGWCVWPSTSLGAKLPNTQDLHTRQCQRKAQKMVKDCSLCYSKASGTGAPSLGPKGSLTASTPKP